MFKDTDTIREQVDLETYLERFKNALETAHSVARKSLLKCQYKQKRLHDLRLLNHQYEIGDTQLTRKPFYPNNMRFVKQADNFTFLFFYLTLKNLEQKCSFLYNFFLNYFIQF